MLKTIFTLTSFHYILLIIFFIGLIYFLYLLIEPIIQKKKVIKMLLNIAKQRDLILIKNKLFKQAFILKYNNFEYNIKIITVSKNCDLQINNIDKWVVYKKSFGSNLSTTVVKDMEDFMNSNLNNRIVILANKAKTIKKVINECEMIMVNPTIEVYGVRILNFDQINCFFK